LLICAQRDHSWIARGALRFPTIVASQYSGDAIVLPGSSANPQSRNSECRADLKGWLRRLSRTANVRSDREHNSPGRAGRSARASCVPPRPGSRAPNGLASRGRNGRATRPAQQSQHRGLLGPGRCIVVDNRVSRFRLRSARPRLCACLTMAHLRWPDSTPHH
jgi:hypothetical protein